MLKQVHKYIVFALLFCNLFFISFFVIENSAFAVVDSGSSSQMELIENDVSVKDLDIDPINTEKVKKSVVPDAKKEGKRVIMLFLKTMMAVAFCSAIIYVVLLFVKKFYGSAFVSNDYDEFETLDLSTPANKIDALKSFLNRTK